MTLPAALPARVDRPPASGAAPTGPSPSRDFRLYQVARFASVVASQMQSVAIGWLVYSLTHRPLDLGYVGLAQFLPAFGLSLVSGHAADRFDRRRILVACHATYALASTLLFAMVLAGATSPLAIYAALVLVGCARAFSGPASQSLLPDLVPARDLARAVALGSTVFEIATIAGPALGGLLYSWAGGGASVFSSCAVLSLGALACVLAMHIRRGGLERRAASRETLLAGVAYVRKSPIILGSISLDLFAVLFGGAVALLPAYAEDVLHVGAVGLGMLRSAPAVGAGLVGALLAVRPLGRRAGAKMLACVALFGLATIVFGLSRSFVLSLVALACIGAFDMVSVVVRLTLVQLFTPAEMRGRVSAVNLVFVGASNELGEFESGVAAALFGLVPAVVLGGVGTCLVVLVWAWLFPALGRVDRLEAPPG